MATQAHPISLIRRQATGSGQGSVLMQGVLEIAPRVLPHSRRAARLLERIGLERPSLKLSGLLAELSAAGHRGIPAVLVDKLAAALSAMLAAPGRAKTAARPTRGAPVVAKLAAALDALEARTRAEDEDAEASPAIARLTLEESPPAFFYAEGRGLDSVPSGVAVMLADLGKRPLSFVPVRGPLLDVGSRLYAIERMRDVLFEPIADEGARLLSMLAAGTVVRLALLTGGGLRVTLRDPATAREVGLDDADADEPGRFLVLSPSRARDVVAALAARDDVTLAWSSAERWNTLRASPQQLRVRLGEPRDWLGVEGGLDIEELKASPSLNDLLRALREGRRYVLARDGAAEVMVALDDALAAALEPMAAAPSGPALSALALAGAHVDDGAAWRALQADLERARAADGEPPAGLRATLRPYQKEGLRFLRRLALWGTGGVLADDMGLGKTVQALGLLVDRAREGPALVVAPTSVCFNWAAEVARFAPGLRVVRYEGPKRTERLRGAGAGDVVIVSYAVLERDARAPRGEGLSEVRWSTLVLDEAQQVKNAVTRRARAVRSLRAEVRFALTGTPLENHTGELWALLDAVSPGLFGSWVEFKARFAMPIEKDADVRRRRTLARAIAPFVLRRKKHDVAPDLPPRTDVVHYLPLDAEERRAYEGVRQALLFDLLRPEDDSSRASRRGKKGKPMRIGAGERKLTAAEQRVRLLAAITRLRLVACHPMFAGDTLPPPEETPPGTKQRALVEMLLELREAGHKALVFSQFVRHLDIARAAAEAAGITTLKLDGSTPAAAREELVARFQAGEADAFFLSLKAGGTGLNLVRASYVIHLDPWWNPAVEDQASDRAHRIGQTEPVTVARLVAEDTLEEQMLELHEDKRALVEGVLAGTAAAASLSVDELVDLVRHTRRTARAEDLVQERA